MTNSDKDHSSEHYFESAGHYPVAKGFGARSMVHRGGWRSPSMLGNAPAGKTYTSCCYERTALGLLALHAFTFDRYA